MIIKVYKYNNKKRLIIINQYIPQIMNADHIHSIYHFFTCKVIELTMRIMKFEINGSIRLDKF